MISHDALAESLAWHLRGPHRMTWCDLQLGPAGSVRPDVYTLEKSFVRPNPMAYECKVSQSDFRADVTSGKWQAYLQYASGVYFACESTLIGKADVPPMCGLIVLKDGAWRAVKRPTVQPVTIPQDALIKLLIDGIEREGPVKRTKELGGNWSYLAAVKQKLGDIVAKTVADRLAVEEDINSAKRTAKRIIDDANERAETLRNELGPLRVELCAILGLPENADQWTMRRAVETLKDTQSQHPAERKLRLLTNTLRNALASHGVSENASEADA